MEFVDPRKEILEDLLQWLDWQISCGATEWPVETIELWDARLPTMVSEASLVKTRPGFLQNASRTSKNSTVQQNVQSGFLPPSVQNPPDKALNEQADREAAKRNKRPSPLQGVLQNLIKDRAPMIDFGLLDERNGLKIVKEHQKTHCKADKPCAIGGGRPTNPILVIEGHELGLTLEARESLGKIMDNVLNIPRNQMYWLPYPIQGIASRQQNTFTHKCGLCPHLYKASLECLSPKLVLIMGGELEQKVSMRNSTGDVAMGVELEFQSNKWTVPAVWTHHPTDMVLDVQMKRECMEHLKTFKRLLRKTNL